MSQRFVLVVQLVSIAATLGMAVVRIRVRWRRGQATADVSRLVLDAGARRAMDAARHEAVARGHAVIGAEHLLLGVLAESDGGAARVLTQLGVDRSALRDEVTARMKRGHAEGRADDAAYSARAMRVLETSLVEAHALGMTHAGSEHLLAGLARDGRSVASRALVRSGVTTSALREAARMSAASEPRRLP